jgi:hypothetical protein
MPHAMKDKSRARAIQIAASARNVTMPCDFRNPARKPLQQAISEKFSRFNQIQLR